MVCIIYALRDARVHELQLVVLVSFPDLSTVHGMHVSYQGSIWEQDYIVVLAH